MPSGTVKFFNETKGYGFIAPDDGGDDLFFHVKNCVNSVEPMSGEQVSFVIGEGRKGPQADKVRPGSNQHIRTADVPLYSDDDERWYFDLGTHGIVVVPPEVGAVLSTDDYKLIAPVETLTPAELIGWLAKLGGHTSTL